MGTALGCSRVRPEVMNKLAELDFSADTFWTPWGFRPFWGAKIGGWDGWLSSKSFGWQGCGRVLGEP